MSSLMKHAGVGAAMATTPVDSSVGSSLTPEVERDAYKEKVEHFKVLIRKLQEEVQYYKVRKEGAETVSKLLQESKQESATLRKKIGLLESIIRNLQSRLESHGLSTDVVLNESETYVPGHSKRLLDNLTRENTRLRSLVRSKSGDPEEFARLTQQNADLEKVCSDFETKIAELEQILRASDDTKDKAINALREELGHVQRELFSREEQCKSLAQQSRTLQQQLIDVAEQCRTMARKLDEQGKQAEKIVRNAAESKAQEASNTAILEENKHLKKQVKEILEMNRRWQVHHTQREEYLSQLQNEAAQLQQRLAEAESRQGNMSRETEAEVNRVLDEHRRLSHDMEENKRVLSRVTGERDRFKREIENARGQIAALKAELQQTKKAGNNVGASADATETINALKAQIQICTEDFESERRDRERAQTKLTRLENDLDHVRKENESLKRTLQAWASPQWASPQTDYNDPVYHQQNQPQPVYDFEGLAARGVTGSQRQELRRDMDRYNVIDGVTRTDHNVIDGVTRTDHNVIEFHHITPDTTAPDSPSGDNQDVDDVTDNVNVKKDDDRYVSLNCSSISSHSKDSDNAKGSPNGSKRNSCDQNLMNVTPEHVDEITSVTADSVLRCPSCNKAYTSTQHPELLEHIENCCD